MARTGVLHNVRELDLAWWIAGSMVSTCSAPYGDEAIRAKTARYPGLLRQFLCKDHELGPNRSVAFGNYNDGKLGITLNVNQPKGVDLVKRLVPICDVVIESFSPRAMRKWGLSCEHLREIKPDIIML